MLLLLKWLGSKTFLIPTLVKMIPPHKRYVEVFGGGGSLLLNKPRSRFEVYNDINPDLVNLFKVIQSEDYEFFREELLKLPINKKVFNELKETEFDDPIRKAIRFYYITVFSWDAMGRSYSYSEGKERMFWRCLGNLDKIHRRLRGVKIENHDFRPLIEKYDREDTFFFLDPPYYESKVYKFKGYRFNFTMRDHLDLKELLDETKGTWILTYNDHQELRELYKKYKLNRVTQKWATRRKESHRENYTHLIITSQPKQRKLESFL